ncbi:hypothetical protein EDD17DRAFT_1654529 [Pisolithus thermaeus]|nr:hypothetical protein EDD17DRAFT_1654529 [Pisolithus thermaeus]
MSTTQEAFSLPTSALYLGHLTDPYNSDGPRTASSLSPSYTYLPQSLINSYSYGLTPPPPYPPLSHTWNRLKLWLAREYPELGDTLNYGFLSQDSAQIKIRFGFALLLPAWESYLAIDGRVLQWRKCQLLYSPSPFTDPRPEADQIVPVGSLLPNAVHIPGICVC